MADVNADGRLEVVAADTHGTLAVFTAKAEELWERHVKSGIAQVLRICLVQSSELIKLVQHGTMAVFPAKAEELWECHLRRGIMQVLRVSKLPWIDPATGWNSVTNCLVKGWFTSRAPWQCSQPRRRSSESTNQAQHRPGARSHVA